MTMTTVAILSTFTGSEIISGIECVKISTQNSGNITMTVQNQGMEIFIKGPFTGTSEYLFAVKEGYFVKLISSTKVNGNLDIQSMSMSMPITIEMKSVTEMK